MSIRMRAPAGFTLIELLVVVSIIAILASMLLPAISLVRTSARQTHCANNLKQLHLLIQVYAEDWGGQLPPRYISTSDTKWADCIASEEFPTAGLQEGTPGNARRFAIFNCPENKEQTWQCGSNPGNVNVSYGPNSNTSLELGWDGRYFGAQQSRIQHSSELLVLMDHLSFGTEPWYEDGASTVPFTPGSMRGVQYRHGRRANLVYADGHTGSTGLLRGRGGWNGINHTPTWASDFKNGRPWWAVN